MTRRSPIGAHVARRREGLSGPAAAAAALLILLAFFAVQSAATQYVAHRLAHPPEFAPQRVAGALYRPWAWFSSWREFVVARDPRLYGHARSISTGGTAALGLAIALTALRRRRRARADASLHGTAHWASADELRRTGLLPEGGQPPTGVFVGGWRHRGTLHYLRHAGPEHVLAFAPTRSGKGVGLVIPTLLTWPHSVLVHDPKGEAWALTAGWRSRAGSRCLRFDPAGEGAARFNPLSAVRIGTLQEVGDAQGIATMIVDPEGKGLNDHWSKTSQSLLTALILHVLLAQARHGRVGTLRDVAELIARPGESIRETLEDLLDFAHLPDGSTHPAVLGEAQANLNKEDRELSSVVSTVASYLALYRDPLVAANTAVSDFEIDDLMHAETPVSLYLVIRPADQARVRPLVRLMITQVVRRLTERMDFERGRAVAHYRHRLLLLIDEFASLARLPVIEEGLAIMAGYGIKAMLIVQDLQQLVRAYGREEAILGNCHVRVAYAPNKIETAELLSKMTGRSTVVRKKRSHSGRGGTLSNVSESLDEVGRPLLTPDEVMRLPGPVKDRDGGIAAGGDMLVFVAGAAPIYGSQVLYFQDPVLSARAAVAPPAE